MNPERAFRGKAKSVIAKKAPSGGAASLRPEASACVPESAKAREEVNSPREAVQWPDMTTR